MEPKKQVSFEEEKEPVVEEAKGELQQWSCIKCRKTLFDSTILEEHTSSVKNFMFVRPNKKGPKNP